MRKHSSRSGTETPFDYVAARRRLDDRVRERKRRNRGLWEQASTDAERIVAMIIRDYHPLRLYQWGSVLDPSRFQDYSDIDIALEGIRDPGEFFGILEKAQRLTAFRVDIVQMETIEPEYANTIREQGKLVFERRQ